MLKGAIFLDVDNLSSSGGYGLDYGVLKKFVESLGVVIVRANAYKAIDEEAEMDPEVKKKREGYRYVVRKFGFKLTLKKIRRYRSEEGIKVKGDSDLDLAVDALTQSDNLDYILLGTGDGDFVKLIQALQSRGKRVDVLSFDNSSGELRRTADNAWDGFNLNLVPTVESGVLENVNREKGFGFVNTDRPIFVHISEVNPPVSNDEFYAMMGKQVEFESVEVNNRWVAKNVSLMEE